MAIAFLLSIGFIIMSFVNDIIIGLVFTAFKLRRPNTQQRVNALSRTPEIAR